MTPVERNLITGLFDRLRKADTNAPAKDREAEELIRQLTTQVPSAAYLLTQTNLVQEHALTNAQARIETLEKQLAQAQQQPPASSGSSGGFLSGLFGGHSSTPPPQQTPPPMPQVQPQAPPYPSTVNMAPSAGGGFLRSALGTAAGVAGGAVLFQGIQNLLGHNAGPFGSFGGGGGGSFLGGGGHPEVVNNYYGDAASEHRHEGSGGGDDGGFTGGGNLGASNDDGFTGGADLGDPIPQGAADQPANPGYEDARYEGSNFDTSNPFDKPVEDNSFFGARDESSLDNNYDADNTDAGSNDFAGGDFVGGDNDDSGTA